MSDKTAVLLLAYGGPDSLEDIPAYLLDIRGGRETPQHLIDEIADRYRQIGGRSPLLGITKSVANRVSEQLGLPVYVGMRHWHPYIKDVVTRMIEDGITHTVVICMAPHYSTLSIGAYKKHLEDALQDTAVTATFVDSWGANEYYLSGVADNIRGALSRFAEAVRGGVKVVFTAHSLPEFILQRGDPYDKQLRETAQLLADRLGLADDRWTFSYQSAAQTGIPWLGPQIEDLVPELAAQGEKNLVVAPIGFITDHVEVLYDIDIGVQEIAGKHGVRVERPDMLNDSDAMVSVLENLVRENTEKV